VHCATALEMSTEALSTLRPCHHRLPLLLFVDRLTVLDGEECGDHHGCMVDETNGKFAAMTCMVTITLLL
jgi:hypothetical protein